MLNRRHFLVATAASSLGLVARAGEQRIRDIRTLSRLPETDAEIKTLHDQSRAFSAELLPEDQPFEVKSFAPFLTKSDEIASAKRLPNTCTRRHVLSVGLEMMKDDESQLPILSRDPILAYLKSHFVSIQARVYREPVSQGLYLGPRCLAATKTFIAGTLTQPFSPTVAESVNNIRSLGLWLPEGMKPTPLNLRTLVLVYKNQLSLADGPNTVAKTNYEYLFIRAREASPDQLELNAFATTDQRKRFHWLNPAELPGNPSGCSVRGSVHFTEFSHQGLYPKSAVIRRSLMNSQKTFDWESVDKYARQMHSKPAMETVSEVLDAVIAGDLRESAADANEFRR